MPACAVLHKGNALAFYRLTDDGRRHAFGRSCFLKCRIDLIEISNRIRTPIDLLIPLIDKLLENGLFGIVE